MCDVLAEAHAARFVHRDIRPECVFLQATADGEVVKVLDFGLATLRDGSDSGGGEDWRADIHGLGAMVYRMLTGVAATTGEAGGEPHGELTSPRELVPTIPASVDAIVMQALSPDPARRPGARELANQFVIALLSASRQD